jgi:hypothetical protein
VSWDPLPLKDRNGVIIEYQIYYMKVGDKIIMKDKAPGTATSFLIKGRNVIISVIWLKLANNKI